MANPQAYGVVELDENIIAQSIEEKLPEPKRNCAVPVPWACDNLFIDIAKSIRPSARSELKVSTMNEQHFSRGQPWDYVLARGRAWLDIVAFESTVQAT